MAAGPALHIFPPVEEPIKRRESFDELIRKSMDMRPKGPWPVRTASRSPVSRARAPINRSRGPAAGRSPSERRGPAVMHSTPIDNFLFSEQSWQPPAGEGVRPKEIAFQNLPPIQVTQRSSSISSGGRPRRSSSVSERNRRLMPAANMPPRRTPSPSPSFGYGQRESPVSTENDYKVPTSAVAQDYYSFATPVQSVTSASSEQSIDRLMAPATSLPSIPDRNNSSRMSNRRRVIVPNEGNEVGSIRSPVEIYQPYQRTVSRTSNRSTQSRMSHPRVPQRQISSGATSSRASHRTKTSYSGTPERRRAGTPSLSDVISPTDGSPTLVRSNSSATFSKWTPQGHEETAPMRSIFPVYNPSVPLQQQSYRPQHVAPLALVSAEKVSKPEYSPGIFIQSPAYKKEQQYITPLDHLGALWSASNGSMTTPDPKTYTLKMFRPQPASEKTKQKITFGPMESKPFYSLTKLHPSSEEDGEPHELLVARHHASKEDILPVSHCHLQPPPPPTTSRSRGSILPDMQMPSAHITTITPIMATLHSLDSAAKTPQAHTLALVDPNATSPAAQRLAERAVAEATAREACTLAWTPTCPRTGKYELHHPNLGVFSIVTEGDVGSALESAPSRFPASISIVNPFANQSRNSSSNSSNSGSVESGKTATNESDNLGSVIARLDLQEDVLFIDAAAIQLLGNLYLIDVCVSTVLSVAVAEAKRPEDPGLIFAAPPPSLLSVKGTSKKVRIKEVKIAKVPKSTKSPKRSLMRPMSLGMGIEHLIPDEDLPRFTKGILNVLGFSFKTAVYLLGISLRVTASMVIKLSSLATKD